MNGETETDSKRVSYWCTAGHEILVGTLEDETIVVDMDGGAIVRLCVQHGCPVGVTRVRPTYPPGA